MAAHVGERFSDQAEARLNESILTFVSSNTGVPEQRQSALGRQDIKDITPIALEVIRGATSTPFTPMQQIEDVCAAAELVPPAAPTSHACRPDRDPKSENVTAWDGDLRIKFRHELCDIPFISPIYYQEKAASCIYALDAFIADGSMTNPAPMPIFRPFVT
eukprot:6213600-Pleurochrysis_carterae.AAC.1